MAAFLRATMIAAECPLQVVAMVSTRIFTEPAGLVASRSWNEKNSVPDCSTICCTGV